MAYATADDLDSYLEGDTPPPHPERLLTLASTRVDEMLVGAVYLTDSAGMPTNTTTAGILNLATLMQAVYMMDTGDEHGSKSGLSSAKTGGVEWTRATSASGSDRGSLYAPNAQSYLRTNWAKLA